MVHDDPRTTPPDPSWADAAEDERSLPVGRILAVASAVLAVVAVVYAAQVALVTASGDTGLDLFLCAWEGVADTLPWLPLVLFAFWFARRFPLDRHHMLRSLTRALAAAAGCALLFMIAVTLEDWLYYVVRQGDARPILELAESVAIVKVRTIVLPALTIFAVAYAVEELDRSKAREIRAAQLESRLATAQLENLRIQLQPHFLFNTLNTISSMVDDDPEGAERMIARLSDLLRSTLRAAGTQLVPLDEELEFLRSYLDIQKERFGERLDVELDIDDATREVPVPPLILQPIVENAVTHGIAHLEDGGRIRLATSLAERLLLLRIENDGPPPAEQDGWGTGLGTSLERLRQLYGGRARLDLAARAEGGARVLLEIPVPEPDGT